MPIISPRLLFSTIKSELAIESQSQQASHVSDAFTELS